jgi:disulfide bond formation protein DsbB
MAMFENEVQTRCAICGTGILLGLVLVLAHLPIILLIGPIIILFLGIIADPEETHTVWYGMLNTLGIFDLLALTDIERLTYAEKRHCFWFGELEMAAMLAGTFVAPVGIFLAGRTDLSLTFIGAAALFLPSRR